MKRILSTKAGVTVLCYGITLIIFSLALYSGITLKPGDEMGYCLIFFYCLMPLTSLISSFMLKSKNGYMPWAFMFVFGTLGIVIPYLIFDTFDMISLLSSFIPAFIGFLLGS